MARGFADTAVTYAYNVDLRANGSGTYTESDDDDGNESTVYLTVHYLTQGSYPTYYLLTAVSGRWVIEDPDRVSVTSARVEYGCSCAIPSVTQESSRYVSNNFWVNTNFTEYIVNYGASLGAKLTLTYLIGTSRTWSFTLTNDYLNSGV